MMLHNFCRFSPTKRGLPVCGLGEVINTNLLPPACEIQQGELLLRVLQVSNYKTVVLLDVRCKKMFSCLADKLPPALVSCPTDQTVMLPDNDPDNPFTVPVTIDSTTFFEMTDGVTINDRNYESGMMCLQ